MVTAICAALAMLDSGSTHREWSRKDFVARLRRIERGDSESKVVTILGVPDDFWSLSDFPSVERARGWKSWSYGSAGHLSFPSLGRIEFENGLVSEIEGGDDEPPCLSDISEPSLHHYLAKLTAPIAGYPTYSPTGDPENRIDPLLVIRWSNLLRTQTKKRAVAILCELSGLTHNTDLDVKAYWTCNALFTSSAKKGTIGMELYEFQLPPHDSSMWPTFPVVFVRGVPFVVPELEDLSTTTPESIPSQIWYSASNWRLRKTTVVPWDDPFPSLAEIRRTAAWRSLAEGGGLAPNRALLERSVMAETIQLVRTVCKPDSSAIKPLPLPYRESQNTVEQAKYDRCHKEFLRLGGHWDKKLQIYVRRDGSHL